MHLAQPAWLMLLALLPLLGAGALLVGRLRHKQWGEFVAARLRDMLLRRASALPRWFALGFLFAACATLIVAMASPQGGVDTKTEKSIGRNVLIALDLSRSMRVKDVKPDRLAQAKVVIYELMEALPNERIGLIGFAGSPNVFAPLTIDHAAVRETIEQIDETWVPLGGSNLSAAIRLAIGTLKETGQKNNALILLSDGEKHDGNLNAVIDEAKKSGVYIFAIGVGTEDGAYVPNPDFPNSNMVDRKGKVVLSSLQPEILRKLATDTNGRYALAGSGTDIPAMVKLAARDLDAFEMQGRERRLAIEFYQWLVLPAILFLLVAVVAGTRWRGIKAMTVLAISLSALPTDACADDSAAAKDLAAGRYAPAREAFRQLAGDTKSPERAARYRLGEGTAAYRAQDFPGARQAFSGALLSHDPAVIASAHFGLANSLFQLGWLTLTAEVYPTAPKPIPDLARFDTLVQTRLAQVLKADAPSDGDTQGLAALESLIINWADAATHYESALANDPTQQDIRHNHETTLTYLRRLRELLDKEREQTQQAIPEPQPSPQPGNPGESDGTGEPKPDDKDKASDKPKDPGAQGDTGKPPKDKSGDDASGDPGKNGKQGAPKAEDNPPDDPDAAKPDETPEEHARRILGDNADLEKGPLRPGRIEYNNPEKDW